MPKVASQAVILPAVPPHSSRQLLWPSPHFIHSSSSVSWHLVRSKAIAPRHVASLLINTHASIRRHAFSQANTLLTRFHFTHSIAIHSVRFSPPAARSCCARRSATACVTGHIVSTSAHASMPHISPSLCVHHALSGILLSAPGVGTRRATSIRSFLTYSSTL